MLTFIKITAISRDTELHGIPYKLYITLYCQEYNFEVGV